MQKHNINRLLTETKFKPLKISHNVVKNNYTVLEYRLQEKRIGRFFHFTGEKQECKKYIASLEKQDTNYLHIN